MPFKDPEARKQWYRKYKAAWKAKIKDAVFLAYGGYRCACCDETEKVFLTIDHINGGGNKHRKALGSKAGSNFYYWLFKNKFPTGYQVLCYNCNLAKHLLGVCPHQINRKEKAA